MAIVTNMSLNLSIGPVMATLNVAILTIWSLQLTGITLTNSQIMPTWTTMLMS